MNIALLGKIIWRFINGGKDPWINILASRYEHGIVVLMTFNANASHSWRGMKRAFDVLSQGFVFGLGNVATNI